MVGDKNCDQVDSVSVRPHESITGFLWVEGHFSVNNDLFVSA
jgi:hypothetical protein